MKRIAPESVQKPYLGHRRFAESARLEIAGIPVARRVGNNVERWMIEIMRSIERQSTGL